MDPVAPQVPSVTYNSSQNCGNIDNSHNNFENCNISVSDETRQVLEWLSPLTSRERHQAVRGTRAVGVGDWLLHTEIFTAWHKLEDPGVKPVLLCYGDPGVGKTYISSLVIDTLCEGIDGGNMAVPYVYCDFSSRNEQTASTVLGSVLRQVVGAFTKIPDEAQRAFENSKRGVDGCGLLLPEILEMLIKCLSPWKRAFICIDALDEFPAKHGTQLWDSLQRVVRECPNTRLFLTGRPFIRGEVRKYFPGISEVLPISPREQDVGLYLKMRLREDPQSDAMNEGLKADILRVIPESISGIFLLVRLNMDAILGETTIHQRRKALHRMTNGFGLQDAYNATLDRIRRQGGGKSKLGMQALMWVSRCVRPLRSEELCHALGVELGEEDISIDNIPSIRAVLGSTLGLVRIDENTSTVHLMHLTLQEYLGQHPTLFITAPSMMAEICLTYLNCRSVRALSPSHDKVLETAAFAEYATCFWGTHAAGGVTEQVKSVALQLLDGYESHISAAILWRNIGGRHLEQGVQGISGLHCVAFWGIAEIAIPMLEMKKWDLNGRDSEGGTPLMWAIGYKNNGLVALFLEQKDIKPDMVLRGGRTAFSAAAELGNECAVKLLLGRGDVDPNPPDYKGRSPLSLAVVRGDESLVKLLLEYGDVNSNSTDNDGQTPLLFASKENLEGIVKLLLERKDVDPNSPDNDSRTPLSLAAARGHDRIVKRLLERRDVNPNSSDSNGLTPLSFASRENAESVVKLLLAREDVNPNPPDNRGRTALAFAAMGGNEGAVKLLLGRGDVNPNSSDNDGRTPLSLAASGGRESALKLLLERADVDPNSPDNDGRTPLALAVSRGHEGAVKQLLERKDVNPNSSDNRGQTPLLFAAEYRYERIVQLLLERRDANPNSPDNKGRTPLSLTVWRGYEGVVKLLLERGDVNPNLSDNGGRTLLSLAVSRGHEGIVILLLERADVNPDSSDTKGQTALALASSGGNEDVVKQLLERWDVNPNSRDHGGRTPLLHAVLSGHKDVMKLLLGSGDVNPNLSDNNGRTALSFAASGTNEGIVKLLLGQGDVDPNLWDNNGRTPISLASSRGYEGVMKLLLERSDIDHNSLDHEGRTPLSFAASGGNEGAVKLLLEREGTSPNSPDNNGRTPLSLAASGGHEGVVKLLLEREDVNPNSPDNNGQTPLSFAASNGHEGVLMLLLERGDVHPNSSDNNGRTPLSYAAEHRCQSAVKLSSDYGNPDRESLETRGHITASLPCEDSPEQASILLSASDVAPHKADYLPPDTSTPRSFSSGPPQEQPLPLKLSHPNQLCPPFAPSIYTPALDSHVGFTIFLLTLILPALILSVFLTYHGYGDFSELFHAIHGAWR